MSYQKFLIAPYNTGLQNDLESWLIPEDAFSELEEMYIFRGRLKKRFGYRLIGDTTASNPQLTSRLRIQINTTNGAGNASGTVPGTIFKIGQMFSVGSTMFTVNATGTPAATLANGTGTAMFNTTTGAYVISGSELTTAVYFYPSEPVMGLITRETNNVNEEDIIAFDTQFAYQRVAGGWDRLDATRTWTGNDTNFFWGVNYRAAAASNTNLYLTNYKFAAGPTAIDSIYYIAAGGATFTQLRPRLNISGTNRFLETALILLPFKDRLIALNTVESTGGVSALFENRCRFSQNGDPTDTTNGWVDDKPGRGGFIDAPTKEVIVSAEFIKDRLIVYFERSTWELVYTANQILPFRWQKINTELGAESTFSKVPFDKMVLSIGNRGILACSGVDIQRIDQKIPDTVYKIQNDNNGPKRVYGIRDYYAEVVYWTFPYFANDPTYPNRLLVYNYDNNTWAIFKDSFTCFGYFQYRDDTTWSSLAYESWEVWDTEWNTGSLQAEFESIIAGNQQGYTVILDRDKVDNDEFMQITDISGSTITSIDHNLETGDYIQIKNAGGSTGVNDSIFYVTKQSSDTFTINTTPGGTYTGGGTLKRVSNPNVITKRFNPFISQGIGFNCPYVDFFVGSTDAGEFTVDFMINEAEYSVKTNPNAIPGTNIVSTAPYALVTSEQWQEKLWHRLYTYMTSFNLQFRFYLSFDQITDTQIAFSSLDIHAMTLYASPAEKVVG